MIRHNNVDNTLEDEKKEDMMKPILHTELCDLLGIEYPIIVAPMGVATGPRLVAAVCNAGGMGILGLTAVPPDRIRHWIKKTKSLTDKPFGVDLLLPGELFKEGVRTPTKKDLPTDVVELVNKLRDDLGVPEITSLPEWEWNYATHDFIVEQIEAIFQEGGVSVFASAVGTAGALMEEFRKRGMKVIGLAGTVKHARRHKDTGVDVVVAQGAEAGGHVNRVGTLTLVPQVRDAINPLPVVAAGGIGDGRGLAAALCMGAVGVWVGTAFLATPEAWADCVEDGFLKQEVAAIWKQKVLEAGDEDTCVTRVYTGKTARMIKNKLIEEWDARKLPSLPMPLQSILIADLHSGLMECGKDRKEYLSMFGGQVAGMVKKIGPAQKIVEKTVEEAVDILQRKAGIIISN